MSVNCSDCDGSGFIYEGGYGNHMCTNVVHATRQWDLDAAAPPTEKISREELYAATNSFAVAGASMNIIGIAGRAGSGKSTVASILVKQHGYVEVAWADSLKRALVEIYDFSFDQLWGSSSSRNAPDRRYPRTDEARRFNESTRGLSDAEWRTMITPRLLEEGAWLTPRFAAQQLGTEFGRACYDRTWIDKGLGIAQRLLSGEADIAYDRIDGIYHYDSWPTPRGVCFSDCRFPNEVDAIHEAGGVVWKTTHGVGLTGAAGAHSSESYIDSLQVDGIIPRVSLAELPTVIENMLKEKR